MNKFNYKRLPPFKWFILENFPFIEADFDALTEWQLLCKLGNELSKVVNATNTLGTQVETLTDYVSNYFDNLDVQEEINNKLDEMAESGELENIIGAYLNLNGVLAFNTVADMIASQNLVAGSTCRTLGKTTYNDGLGRLYKIEHIISATGVDGINLINLNRDDLYARLITEQYLTDISNLQTNVTNLSAKIGNLENLDTQNKTSIVNAINSIQKLVVNSSLPAGTTFHLVAGAVRQNPNDDNEWFFINDSNHEPVGVSSVEIVNNSLKITYDDIYDEVISFICAPDESLGGLNVTAGASVGLDYSLINIGCAHKQSGDVYYDGSNWVDTNGGTVSFSNGILTLTLSNTITQLQPYGFEVQTINRGYNTYKDAIQLQSGLRVCFYDSNGNKVTTPSTDMAFRYYITNASYLRPYTHFPAGSNIWFMGIMAKYPPSSE